MLVSGVWRLWLTPRRKSSLAASSSRSWAFCASTWPNSCGVADRDRDLAGEQLEQVLVGALPGRGWPAGARRARPSALVAGPQDGPERARLAGDDLLDRDLAGSTRRTSASIRPKAACGVARPPVPARNSTPSRGETPSIAARIRPSSRLRRSRSAARRLWLSARRASSSSPGDPDRRRQVAGRHAIDGGRDRPQRAGQVGRQQVGDEDRRAATAIDEREQQEPRRRSGRPPAVGDDADRQDQQPERGQRQDRRDDQGQRQPGPEAASRAADRRRRPSRDGRRLARRVAVARPARRHVGGRRSSAAVAGRDEPVADAADRLEVDRAVRVDARPSGAAGAS